MFYEQFQLLCKRHNIKETSLARELGMGASAPGRWKKGSTPDLVNAKKIADYFGVTVDSLIQEDSNKIGVISNISNSAVIQGNTGNNVNVSNGIPISESMNEQEQELLRIFRGLTFRSKTKLMSLAFQVEDEDKMQ